jgi:hypothetical protein
MQDHRVKIIAYLDRATGVCTCGFSTRERFGDRRTANAKHGLLIHLEATYHDKEYHIKDGAALVCPLCKSDLDLASGDLGLLDVDQPSVIACEKHHEFDAYHKDKCLFLFVNDAEDGPFATY